MHVLRGYAQVRWHFPRIGRADRDARVQLWARALLALLDVELRVCGAPPAAGATLLVCNHISWLDVVALHAVCHCRFVSKADVRGWPLIGALATGGATLYVRRDSRRDAMRVVHRMTAALEGGDLLAVFPEGTTGDGRDVLPFHASLIQAAISAGAPAQPVALTFDDGDGSSNAASYVGDESLVGSIWRTLRARNLAVTLAFGHPQYADGRGRRAWAQQLRSEVVALRSKAIGLDEENELAAVVMHSGGSPDPAGRTP